MAENPQNSPRMPYSSEEPRASLISNILAISGFIILIVVVIWGLVNLASLSRGWFSAFFGEESAIEVSAPEVANSGSPFTLSWEYEEPAEGIYTFLYPCHSGLQFRTPGPVGGVNSIPCGAAFTVASENNELALTPILERDEALDVPLSIIFMPSATGTQAQGSATVNISPASSPAPTPPSATPAPQPNPSPSPATPSPAPAPSTPADLSVRIISVSVDPGGNGIATFDITNVGGRSSGTYYFTAQLPVVSGQTYSSPAQSSLSAGSYIRNTLRFSGAVGGTFSVTITTPDANGANNYAAQGVNAPYGGAYNTAPAAPSYQYGYDYSYQQYGQMYAPTQYQGYPYEMYPSNYQYQPYTQYSPYSTYYPYAY